MKKNGRKRQARVQLLLTPHEKKALEAYAQLNDKSVTAAVRALLAEEVDGFAQKLMPKAQRD